MLWNYIYDDQSFNKSANGFVAPQSIRRPNLSYKTEAVHYELAIRLQNYRCQEYN